MGSGGQLTKSLIFSGISRIAIPALKGKSEGEIHLGSVLVLHLQCKNVTVLTVGALDPFHSLKNLYLYKNNIRRIQGLDQLYNLELLDLSRNNVERIGGLDKCKKLKHLYLGFNEIQVVEGLENLIALEELQIDDQDVPPEQPLIFSPRSMAHLSHCLLILEISSNQLSSLAPIANLCCLLTLNAADNCLKNMDEVLKVLQSLYELRNLTLKGNPVSKKPTYKPSVIGAVYKLEILDGKSVHHNTRCCVQRLKAMKQNHAERVASQEKMKNSKLSLSAEGSNSSEFNLSTPIAFPPPPRPFKLRKRGSAPPAISKSVTVLHESKVLEPPSVISLSEDSLPSTAAVLDSSMYELRARHSSFQASEFKDEFTLDHDNDGMSDMAKIIFRLSNLDEIGSGDTRMFHSAYWDLPGSSMLRECRPLSPLEGVDLALPISISHSKSTPELGKLERKPTGTRPKPAAPGGRQFSNNSYSGTISSPEFSLTEHTSQQPPQKYIYGRTLSPLMELPTPESLTARDENT